MKHFAVLSCLSSRISKHNKLELAILAGTLGTQQHWTKPLDMRVYRQDGVGQTFTRREGNTNTELISYKSIS